LEKSKFPIDRSPFLIYRNIVKMFLLIGGLLFLALLLSGALGYYLYSPSTTSTTATPPVTQRTCKQLPDIRLPGGGHKLGADADHVLPYPYTATSTEDCEKNCLANPQCKQYVNVKGSNACYQMNTAYPYDPTADKDAAFVSGLCT
jgi:hypothetical protein